MIELIGFILPPLIDLINKNVTDSRWRFVISFVTCVGVGMGMNVGNFNAESVGSILGSITVVFSAAQVAYKLYWEKSEVRTKLRLKF